MSHAFAPESMAHCAAKGHKYRHVRGWHAVGWQECYCCGQTLDGLSNLEPQQIFNPTTQQAEPYTPEPVFYTQRSRVDNCVASGPITVGEMVAAVNDATERIAVVASVVPKRPRSKHPPRAPKGAFAIGERNTKADRNAAVLAMLAEGKSVTEVAQHFGLTQPRIGQIVRAYAPPDFVRPPMGGIEKKRLRDERNAEIRRRDAAGEKPKDIATALGVCTSVVHKLLASQITPQGVAP